MTDKLRAAGITCVASWLPKQIITNEDIVKMGIDTSDKWITEHTGIKERRWHNGKGATSDFAANAAKKLLKKAKLKATDIDMIIVATCSPDTITPSTACYVQHKIGAIKAAAMDVNNACSGFNYALAVGSKFVADKTYDNVLVIGAEFPSKYIHQNERTTFVFFGDGAGAVLLQEVKKDYGIMSNYLRADGSGAENLIVEGIGTLFEPSEAVKRPTIKMDGRAIWNFALQAIPDAAKNCTEKAGLKIEDVDFVIFHQANYNIITEGMKLLGLPMSKTFSNINKYGNTIAASIPIALEEALEKGKIKKGDIVMFIGFGAGLSWGANLMRWS
ncbi:MAG: ketoacyl-ACP synthase III [archaeon]|nr:ketoacyl-ACP synthase III [archaeon]